MHTDCSIKSGDILQDLKPDGTRTPPLDAIAPLERRLPKTPQRNEDDEVLSVDPSAGPQVQAGPGLLTAKHRSRR
jgi:hypothetical protein